MNPRPVFAGAAPSLRKGRHAALAGSLAGLFALGLFVLLWVTTAPYGGSPVEAGPVRLRVRPLGHPTGACVVSRSFPRRQIHRLFLEWRGRLRGTEELGHLYPGDRWRNSCSGHSRPREGQSSPPGHPDGRFIAFSRDWPAPAPGCYVVSLRDGSETRLMGFDYGPFSWTPDGKWLVAFDEDAKVAAISMQTRELRKFTAHTVAWWEQDAAVSPDGKTVAFARCLTVSSCDVYVKPLLSG